MKHLTLTRRQQEILIGLLLGDGHLETQTKERTYRLKIEHSIRQKEYVDWLYAEFHHWVRTPPQQRTRNIILHGKEKEYTLYWFNTVSSGSFRFYAHQFYRKRKKVIPRLIHRWLHPLSLAVWYMDDGAIKSNAHRAVLLNTQNFQEDDLKRVQKALKEKFGIETKRRLQKDGIQLYILSETIERFQKIILPYIHPSMQYKLPKTWLTQLPKK